MPQNNGNPRARIEEPLGRITENDESLEGSSNPLSLVSNMYDAGEKGYLTVAERQLREMDVNNEGKLSVEQIAQVVRETMAEQKKNRRLQLMAAASFGALIVLAISNLGTAFLAANLAKDTSVNHSTGRMTVRGEDFSVTTIAGGQYHTFQLQYDDLNRRRFICVKIGDAAQIFNSAIGGTSNSLVLNTRENSSYTFGLTSGRSSANSTHACFGTTSGDPLCSDFMTCGTSKDGNNGRSLSAVKADRARKFRRLVREARTSATPNLALTTPSPILSSSRLLVDLFQPRQQINDAETFAFANL